MKSTVLLFTLFAISFAQDCRPVNYYVLRHTERYNDGFLPPNAFGLRNWDAMLTVEGLEHAERLRDKFVDEHLPLDAIFVSEVAYSYSTALFLAREREIPIFPYVQEFRLPAGSGENDLVARIGNMEPCPQSVLVVNHGFTMRGILRELGYTGPDLPDDNGPDHYSRFGMLYNLFILPDGTDVLNRLNFGVRGTEDPPTPCLPEDSRANHRYSRKGYQKSRGYNSVPFDTPKLKIRGTKTGNNQCDTPNLYTMRHTERFGIGFIGTDNPFYAANYDAVLTGPGFEHALELVNKFANESLPLDAIYVNVGYNFAVGMELAKQTGLPMYVYFTELDLFPAPEIPSDVIERIERMDPCPTGVLVINHGTAAQYPVQRDYGYLGPPDDFMQFFGSIYHLRKLPDGAVQLDGSDFGGFRGTRDPPRPCDPPSATL